MAVYSAVLPSKHQNNDRLCKLDQISKKKKKRKEKKKHWLKYYESLCECKKVVTDILAKTSFLLIIENTI